VHSQIGCGIIVRNLGSEKEPSGVVEPGGKAEKKVNLQGTNIDEIIVYGEMAERSKAPD
jgi:hypothetical protein